MLRHVTHTGEIITGERVQLALNIVAQFWLDNAYAVRKQDQYASHVTTKQKDHNLSQGIKHSQAVKNGQDYGFTTWQRLNNELTGECVAFLPK